MKYLFCSILSALIGIAICSGEEQPRASDLMSYSKLHYLATEHKELWETISKEQDNKATPEQAQKSTELVKAVFAENKLRRSFYEAVEEGKNISDYPGILEKLNILYEKAFVQEGSKNYIMFFLTTVLSDEGDPVIWITVDLKGKIVSKGRTTLAH